MVPELDVELALQEQAKVCVCCIFVCVHKCSVVMRGSGNLQKYAGPGEWEPIQASAAFFSCQLQCLIVS